MFKKQLIISEEEIKNKILYINSMLNVDEMPNYQIKKSELICIYGDNYPQKYFEVKLDLITNEIEVAIVEGVKSTYITLRINGYEKNQNIELSSIHNDKILNSYHLDKTVIQKWSGIVINEVMIRDFFEEVNSKKSINQK